MVGGNPGICHVDMEFGTDVVPGSPASGRREEPSSRLEANRKTLVLGDKVQYQFQSSPPRELAPGVWIAKALAETQPQGFRYGKRLVYDWIFVMRRLNAEDGAVLGGDTWMWRDSSTSQEFYPPPILPHPHHARG